MLQWPSSSKTRLKCLGKQTKLRPSFSSWKKSSSGTVECFQGACSRASECSGCFLYWSTLWNSFKCRLWISWPTVKELHAVRKDGSYRNSLSAPLPWLAKSSTPRRSSCKIMAVQTAIAYGGRSKMSDSTFPNLRRLQSGCLYSHFQRQSLWQWQGSIDLKTRPTFQWEVCPRFLATKCSKSSHWLW